MKAEINVENKELFFALYINQPVLADNIRKREVLDKSYNWRHKDFWLNLKPLSAISDEDAIALSHLASPYKEDAAPTDSQRIKWAKWYIQAKRDGRSDLPYWSADFIRSRGYLISWMGLTEEELIAAGWVKLIDQ